jgi:hypothetical protein
MVAAYDGVWLPAQFDMGGIQKGRPMPHRRHHDQPDTKILTSMKAKPLLRRIKLIHVKLAHRCTARNPSTRAVSRLIFSLRFARSASTSTRVM